MTAKCGFEDTSGDLETLRGLGLDFATLYGSAGKTADFALALKAKRNQDFCLIPFCHTLEAEALGGDVFLGDETAGSRPGRLVYSRIEEIMQQDMFSANRAPGRLETMLAACRELKGRNEQVVFTMSGPFSILSALIDLTCVFKVWRKEPLKMAALFDFLSRQLLEFAVRIKAAGADGISFADPAGAASVLGPKFSALAAEGFISPFLQKLAGVCGGKPVLLLCPVTAQCLTAEGSMRRGLRICCTKSLHNFAAAAK